MGSGAFLVLWLGYGVRLLQGKTHDHGFAYGRVFDYCVNIRYIRIR